MRTVLVLAYLSILATALLLPSRFGARKEYSLAPATLSRDSWDRLHIPVAFTQQATFGGASLVAPEDATISLYSAGHEVLYTGAGPTVVIDDGRLGDREQMVVEVCAKLYEQTACEQYPLEASPKRVRVEEKIVYPERAQLNRGSYDLRFGIERQVFQGQDWERLEAGLPVTGHLLVYVEGHADGAVTVPFTRSRGRFDLSRHARYDDFLFYLKSKLYDDDEARVRFDVYAGLNKDPVRLSSMVKRVRNKTEEDRRREVEYFVEQAAGQVLEREPGGADGAFVYVNTWDYDAINALYEIALEIHWRGSSFRRRRLAGTLAVKEDGSSPVFYREAPVRDGKRHLETREAWTLAPLGLPEEAGEDADPEKQAAPLERVW